MIDCQGSAASPHRAFYLHSGETASSVIEGIKIINGWAPESGHGGAIRTLEAVATIHNCIFADNHTAGIGGAICLYGDGPFTILNCSFTNNMADGRGGAIHIVVLSNTGNLLGCTFDENNSLETAPFGGGAVFAWGDPVGGGLLRVEDCVFTENSTTGCGGAMNFTAGTLNMEDCHFIGNTAGRAAGGLQVGGTASLESVALSSCLMSNNTCGTIGGGLFVSQTGTLERTVSIDGCTFADNTATGAPGFEDPSGGGACVSNEYTAGETEFSGCVFHGNSVAIGMRGGGGASCGGYPPQFSNCTFTSNNASVGAGLTHIPTYLLYPMNLNNSIVPFNTSGEAISVQGEVSVQLACCDVYGNDGGDWIGPLAGLLGQDGNISEDPQFCDLLARDLSITSDSPCSPDHSPQGCGLIGAEEVGCPPLSSACCIAGECQLLTMEACTSTGGTYIAEVHTCDPSPCEVMVRPDGGGDFATIQAAIDAVHANMVIELGNGVFQGIGNRNINYHGKAITVRSENDNPEACIIDCESSGVGFFFNSSEDGQSCLRSVTVKNGLSGAPGGGILCIGSSSPVITNCHIIENVALAFGGIGCWNCASPTIEDCIIARNVVSTSGGGIGVEGGHPLIANCTIVDNDIPESYDGSGGGIAISSGSPTLTNCTIAHNQCNGAGAGVWIKDGSSTVDFDHCIIAFNENSNGIECPVGRAALTCSDVFSNDLGDWIGGIAGLDGENGNICLDPVFCDAANGNYTFLISSPCAICTEGGGHMGPYEHVKMCSAQPGDGGSQVAGGLPSAASVDGADAHETAILGVRASPYGMTDIAFNLAAGTHVSLRIVDLNGRVLRTLQDGHMSSGAHHLMWDGRDDHGNQMMRGIYFYALSSDKLRNRGHCVFIR